MHAFETPGKARLRIRNPAGAVTIEATDTNETTVELEALRDDDATRESIAEATVEMSGGEVVVELGTGMKGFGIGPAWISFGRTPQVGIMIRCPEGSDVNLATASADLMARGRLGEVEAKSASGDLHVENVAGAPVPHGERRRPREHRRRRGTPADGVRRRAAGHGPPRTLPRPSSRATSRSRRATRTSR